MEYLVTMTTTVPDGTPQQAVDEIRAREAAHSAELAARGSLLRLWRPPLGPGEWRSLGLFAAPDAGQLEEEVANEDWILELALADDAFTDEPDELWSDVLRRKGGIYELVARMPEDPSLN